MTLTFAQLLQATALEMLQALGGESVNYIKPSGSVNIGVLATAGNLSGSPATMATAGNLQAGTDAEETRAITAIVERNNYIAKLSGAPYGTSPVLEVTVVNDSDDGISSDEIDTGRDIIELAVRLGETAQRRRITKILWMDEGMLGLEVR